MGSSSFTKQIKNVPFSNGAKEKFPKLKRNLMLPNSTVSVRGSTDDEVEILVADGDKSPEEIQAIRFAKTLSSWPDSSSLVPLKTRRIKTNNGGAPFHRGCPLI